MGSVDTRAAPTAADIDAAAARLAGVAVRTPLINAPVLDERLSARVFLKVETLQRTGSFKFRGAYNRISQIPPARREAGVVAYSSGNHAQGVAAAARLLGIRATIVMPADAPRSDLDFTDSTGATRGRRGGLFLGQPRAGRRGSRATPRHPGNHRHAGGCAAFQTRAHGGARRRGRHL